MSLVVVGLTSAFGAANHWRAGTVDWRAALTFGPPAIVGSLLGAELGLRVMPDVQLTVFAVVMLAAAASMYVGKVVAPAEPGVSLRARPHLLVSVVGAAVGVLTGFVGVGGGFLYVPALVLLGGLAMKRAVGTSLVLILLSCGAAVLRYHGSRAFDWPAIALFTALAFVGVAAGSRLVPHLSQQALRKGFAVFLVGMGVLVLLRRR